MKSRPLVAADLPRAAALSRLAGWNQTPADWALFLRLGVVRMVEDDQTVPVATIALMPYGRERVGIAMVLVRPDRRRRGIATALMRWALAQEAERPSVMLDATPAGRELYRRLGFRDLFGLMRLRLPPSLPQPPGRVRPISVADWPAVLALDRTAFGAPRATLLRDFAARCPKAALLGEEGAGFVLARDGAWAPQIGPVVAPDLPRAQILIAAAAATLKQPALIDIPEWQDALLSWLRAHGATPERPFMRMVRGADLAGEPRYFAAVAGPEFG